MHGLYQRNVLKRNMKFMVKTISQIKNELVKILFMIGVVYFSTTAGPWDHNRTEDRIKDRTDVDLVGSRSFGF